MNYSIHILLNQAGFFFFSLACPDSSHLLNKDRTVSLTILWQNCLQKKFFSLLWYRQDCKMLARKVKYVLRNINWPWPYSQLLLFSFPFFFSFLYSEGDVINHKTGHESYTYYILPLGSWYLFFIKYTSIFIPVDIKTQQSINMFSNKKKF